MEVICHIHGADLDESEADNSKCYFYVAHPVTLTKIRDLFPFENAVHFRAKVFGSFCGLSNVEYLWLDLVNPHEEVPCSGDALEIQALILHAAADDDNDDDDNEPKSDTYLDEINSTIPNERQNQRRVDHHHHTSSSSSSSSQKGLRGGLGALTGSAKKHLANSKAKLNMKNMKKGASGLWKGVMATATYLQQVAEATIGSTKQDYIISPNALDHLEDLSTDVSTLFDHGAADHRELLCRLYASLFPGAQQPYSTERDNIAWKTAGWQSTDPAKDLKTSGLLALRAMMFLADKRAEHTQRMLEKNKANIKANYPFAIVGINLTLMLIELFHLRDSNFAHTKTNFWSLFEEPFAFYEVFCLCFLHLDQMWVSRNSTRADFGKLIGEVKALMSQILAVGPQNVEEFKLIAAEEGMVVM